MAIAACREERSDRVQNRAEMMTVKETLNDGYCDVTGGGDISHIGKYIGLASSSFSFSFLICRQEVSPDIEFLLRLVGWCLCEF